jgi:hypothetical protein
VRRRLAATVAGAGLVALALGLTGCTSAPSAGPRPAPLHSSATPTTNTATTGQGQENSTAPGLTPVEDDLADVNAAVAQADTDIAAGEAAQAQNDNP